MTPSKLRFRARGEALVQNFERLEAGIKSFVGRKYVEAEPGRWGFAPTDAADEVAFRAEYVKACKDADLWPADAETAAACGVPFDPSFGAKVPEKSAAKPSEKG
jgi:hypothetical protein